MIYAANLGFAGDRYLPPVVTAFRDRKNVFTDTSYVNESAIQVLEKSVGLKIDSIQKVFNKWLDSTYHFGIVKQNTSILSQLYDTERTLEVLQHEAIPEDAKKLIPGLLIQCRQLITEVSTAQQVNAPVNNVSQQGPPSSITPDTEKKALDFLEYVAQLARKYSEPKRKMKN